MSKFLPSPISQRASRLTNYGSIGFCILLQSLALTAGKQAGVSGSAAGLIGLVLNPWYCLSLLALFLQALLWVQVLRKLPLSVAYPYMSLVFPLNLLAAAAIFGEPIGAGEVAGTLCIVAGVALAAREAAA